MSMMMSMNQEQTIAYIQERARSCSTAETRQEWERLIGHIQSVGLDALVGSLWQWLDKVKEDTDPSIVRKKQNALELFQAIEHGPYSRTRMFREKVERRTTTLEGTWEWKKILEVLYARRLHGFLLEVEAGEAVLQDFASIQEEIATHLDLVALPYKLEMERILEEEVYE
jgi:hypothetical protein